MNAKLSNRLYVPTNLVEDWHSEEYMYMLENGRDPVTKEPIIDEVRTFKDFSKRGYVGFHRGDLGKI